MPIRCFAAVFIAVFAAGCGGPTLVPVSGTITLDNQPLAGAYLTFEPVEGTGDLVSTGVTNEAGEYTLSCGDEPGAVPGSHRVLITTISPDDYRDEHSTMPRDRVPPNYQDGTLTREVPKEGSDSVDFPLVTRR